MSDAPEIPHSREMEQRVLARFLTGDPEDNARSFAEFGALGGDERLFFVWPSLYRWLAGRHERGDPMDLVACSEAMPPELVGLVAPAGEGGGQRQAFLGLMQICRAVPTHANFEWHVSCLRTLRHRRDALRYAALVREEALNLQGSPEDLIERIQRSPASDMAGANGAAVTGKEAMREWWDRWRQKRESGERDTVLCGLPGLDDRRGGLDWPGLAVVGAFPSSGKTALAVQVAARFLLDGRRVHFFTLEMPVAKLCDRLMIHLCAFEDPAILTDPHGIDLTADAIGRIRGQTRVLATDELIIDPTAGIRVSELCGRARAAHARKPLGLVVIDFIQRVRGGKGESLEQRYTDAICELQGLMKDLSCVVLVCCQLNKDGDTKYAASIEENADLFLKIARARGEAEVDDVVVAKDRHRGMTGARLNLDFHKLTQRFSPKHHHHHQH